MVVREQSLNKVLGRKFEGLNLYREEEDENRQRQTVWVKQMKDKKYRKKTTENNIEIMNELVEAIKFRGIDPKIYNL